MTFETDRHSYQAYYDHRRSWLPNREGRREMTEEELRTTTTPDMEPAGRIVQEYTGGHIETWVRIEVKGRKRPLEMPLSKALTVMSAPEVSKKEREGKLTKIEVRRGGEYRSVVELKGQEPIPLDEACQKAADDADKKLREKGYLPKMPQSVEAIQGRR